MTRQLLVGASLLFALPFLARAEELPRGEASSVSIQDDAISEATAALKSEVADGNIAGGMHMVIAGIPAMVGQLDPALQSK